MSFEPRMASRYPLGSSDGGTRLMVRSFLDHAWRDVRLACRTLAATPLATLVAVASLALGIGANTAIFSLLNSLLLRTLPVSDPARLVLVSDGSVAHVR